jgi:hypothetical protein
MQLFEIHDVLLEEQSLKQPKSSTDTLPYPYTLLEWLIVTVTSVKMLTLFWPARRQLKRNPAEDDE